MAVRVIAHKMVRSRLYFIHVRDKDDHQYLYRDTEIAHYLCMNVDEYRTGLRRYTDEDVSDKSRIYFPSREATQRAIDEFVVPRLMMKLMSGQTTEWVKYSHNSLKKGKI